MAVFARQASDVRINEVDLSASITSVSQATGALVVVSAQGPDIPRFYSNADDFTFDFGNPKVTVSYDHYAALDYFREGNALWAVRALGTGAKYAGATLNLGIASPVTDQIAIAPISGGVVDPTDIDWDAYTTSTERPLFCFTSRRGAGSYGNDLAIGIDSENVETPVIGTPVVSTTGGSLTSGTYNFRVSAVSKSMESLASSVITVTVPSGTTNKITIPWTPVRNAIGYKVYGRSSGSVTFMTSLGGFAASFVDDGTLTPGSALPITLASAVTVSKRFTVNVYDTTVSATKPVESFYCSTVEEVDETGAQMEVRQRINPFSKYVYVNSDMLTYGEDSAAAIRIRTVYPAVNLGGGASGSAPTANDVNDAWDKFLNTELYKPDILIGAGRGSVTVYNHMEGVARTRNDCVAFIDVPSSYQLAQDSVDWRNLTLNMNSSYAALFTGDLMESDPINGKMLYVPQSGACAALYAKTNRVGQPWFSIAGLNRGIYPSSVLGIRYSYDDAEATNLMKSQVNYPRRMIGRGTALWEQWTCYNKSSALQFLNVRFLCNNLKRALYDYLIYGLQEPNDDILRKQLKTGIEEYLAQVKAGRGISSYNVIIDDSNNPAAAINSGVLVITIIIVPILAVQSIRLTLGVSKEGYTVSEAEISAMSA